MPSVNNQVTEDLSPEQIGRLLAAIDDDPDNVGGIAMKLALLTGMRKGEILGLRWMDIDFDRGFIRLVSPKGGRDALIPLNVPVREVLESIPRAAEYVLPGRDGGPRKEIRRQVDKIRKAAELPEGFRPLHGLRHVFASMLASSGEVDLYALQRLLTHKNHAVTERYAHLRDSALRKASGVVERLIADNGHQTKVRQN